MIIGIYLPVIESAYRSCYESPLGAKGLYQFLPTTARNYGVSREEMCDAEKMTPAAVDLALEIRREIESRYDEADQLRCRAIERAQIDADLAQRRFMMVDPGNRRVQTVSPIKWGERAAELVELFDKLILRKGS